MGTRLIMEEKNIEIIIQYEKTTNDLIYINKYQLQLLK